MCRVGHKPILDVKRGLSPWRLKGSELSFFLFFFFSMKTRIYSALISNLAKPIELTYMLKRRKA